MLEITQCILQFLVLAKLLTLDSRMKAKACSLSQGKISTVPEVDHIWYFLTVANIICYIRIFLTIISIWWIEDNLFILAILNWISIILDNFDGYFARLLNQCTSMGALLDIICDNLAHFALWIAVFYHNHNIYIIMYGFISVSLTWMFMTVMISQHDNYKKNVKEYPFILKLLLANDMNNLFGLICYYGLFLLPTMLSLDGKQMSEILNRNALYSLIWNGLLFISSVGQLIMMCCNLWWIFRAFICLNINDEQRKKP